MKEGENMKFKRYNDLHEFVKENDKLINEKEWLNNLMIGNINYGLKNGTDEGWLMAKVEDNGNTELIMLLRRPWKLLLYSPTNNSSDELYKFTSEAVYEVDKDIPGVNAEKVIANKFAKYYCEKTQKDFKLHTPMRILVIKEMIPFDLKEDVVFRSAKQSDKDVLTKFIQDFHVEALHDEWPYEKAEEYFYNHLDGGYYVLEHNGKIVSQVVAARRMPKGIGIGGVYTPKEERGKGYAFNVVYRATKLQFDNGSEYCVLYTDDKNPISNHVYEKMGYKRMVDVEDLDFVDEK